MRKSKCWRVSSACDDPFIRQSARAQFVQCFVQRRNGANENDAYRCGHVVSGSGTIKVSESNPRFTSHLGCRWQLAAARTHWDLLRFPCSSNFRVLTASSPSPRLRSTLLLPLSCFLHVLFECFWLWRLTHDYNERSMPITSGAHCTGREDQEPWPWNLKKHRTTWDLSRSCVITSRGQRAAVYHQSDWQIWFSNLWLYLVTLLIHLTTAGQSMKFYNI